MNTMVRPFSLVAAACIALGACQLPGGGEPPELFTLTPKSSFSPDLPRVDWQLIVETPVAAASLNTGRIALQRSPVRLEYYAQSSWTDVAPLMVQTLLIESFENTGKIVAVGRESAGLRADYVLKTELREFQAEYDGAGPPEARVRLNAKLVRMPDRTIIASHTAEHRTRAADSQLESVAMAFDDALGQVMREIVEWTLRAPSRTPSGEATRGARPAPPRR